MKCGNSWKGKSVNMQTKEEYSKGTLSTIRDNFRVYDSVEEGIKGYFDFISTKRYANLKNATTPQQYLEMIRADGYATSYTYVTTNMNCIKKWDLTQYDNLETSGINPYKEPFCNVKKGMCGNLVKWIQYALNQCGYNLVVDGIFGHKTDEAVKEFQKDNDLVIDGIVGIKTRTKLKEKLA
jgi:murein L,D-transpeptidase YcbB/YkuD